MELDSVRRIAYWSIYTLFLLITMIFSTADRLTLLFRLILVLLLGFLSAMFRLKVYYGALSLLMIIPVGFLTGAVLAGSGAQFWALSFIWFIVFFLACEAHERKMFRFLGV